MHISLEYFEICPVILQSLIMNRNSVSKNPSFTFTVSYVVTANISHF